MLLIIYIFRNRIFILVIRDCILYNLIWQVIAKITTNSYFELLKASKPYKRCDYKMKFNAKFNTKLVELEHMLRDYFGLNFRGLEKLNEQKFHTRFTFKQILR